MCKGFALILTISASSTIKNTFYGELNSFLNYEDEEEEVLGFNDTESVDYLCIIDQTVTIPEKTTSNIRPVPKPRRRSVQSNKVVPPPPPLSPSDHPSPLQGDGGEGATYSTPSTSTTTATPPKQS